MANGSQTAPELRALPRAGRRRSEGARSSAQLVANVRRHDGPSRYGHPRREVPLPRAHRQRPRTMWPTASPRRPRRRATAIGFAAGRPRSGRTGATGPRATTSCSATSAPGSTKRWPASTSTRERPAFKHFVIRPRPVGDLKWVRATHQSIYGPIAVSWQAKDNAVFAERHGAGQHHGHGVRSRDECGIHYRAWPARSESQRCATPVDGGRRGRVRGAIRRLPIFRPAAVKMASCRRR